MIEDSPRRCVRCGKRMHMSLDQDDVTFTCLKIKHECWSCGFTEWENRTVIGGTSTAAAERLARLRNA